MWKLFLSWFLASYSVNNMIKLYDSYSHENTFSEMKEFIYHALGICGEHSHPHLLNVGYILLATFILYKIVKLKSRLNG